MASVDGVKWKTRFEPFLTGKTKNGGSEHVGYCANCESPQKSSTPSASYNFQKGAVKCFGKCGQGFKLSTLWNILLERKDFDNEVKASKQKKSGGRSEPLPSAGQVDRWCEELFAIDGVLDILMQKRGLSTETLSDYNIGYRRDRKRYTIPVYDRDGTLLNVRQYHPTARAAKDKMINVTGHGEAQLYLPDALDQEEILLCEGEMDALTGRDKGFNSMSFTSGVMGWQEKWSPLFEGKTVFICFDDDDRGKQGARKTANSLTRRGAQVHIIQLAISGIKGGDLTDYFVSLGNSPADFKDLMEESRHTVAGQVKRAKVTEMEPFSIHVERSMDSENLGRPVKMIGTVHGKAASPSHLPKVIEYSCWKDWGDKCQKCGLFSFAGKRRIELDPGDRELMRMIEKTDEQVQKLVFRLADVPTTCPKVDAEELEQWTVEELQVMPSVENRSEEIVNPVDRTVYNFGLVPDLEINKTYEITGLGTRHPKDQKSVFQSWNCEPVQVDIERFQMTPEIYEQLKIFQPDEWSEQTPYEKLKEIARDLSLNVTNIYGRPELHIGLDLVWHSVNSFFFKGKKQDRGWVECLIIGDTRTGKSEAASRLMEHYTSGTMVNADRASFAGLVGGASQKGSSKQWGITWGVIPLNDRRLVILDEAGGLTAHDISAMSSVRSSGVAEIVKMGGRKTSARTRLVWIANPVTNRPIVEMANGVMDEIGEFIPTPEDIARFDFAMAAATDDVSMAQINVERRAKTPHLHYADDCKQLITWVWSRKTEQVKFQRGVEEYIYTKSDAFSQRYVPDLPLVQKQSFHLKLARLSAAVAARLFSTDETGENVIIKRAHVDTALKFLDMIYGMDSFGYKEYSMRRIEADLRAKNNAARAVDYLWEEESVRVTLISVMDQDKFKNRDFEERGGMDKFQAQEAAQKLIQLGMLRSMSRGYIRMTPVMLDIIRQIRRDEEKEHNREAAEEAENN